MNDNNITVFHAHTGIKVRVNRYYFLSLDELKRFCSSQFGIPSQQLFLLSSYGHKLKSSSLEHIDEVYIYDKNLFSIDNVQSIQRYILSNYSETFDNLIHPISSPLHDIDLERLATAKNSRQMISFLTTNLGWVAAIESDANLFLSKLIDLRDRVFVLFKSLKVANLYIENYCSEVKKSYDASLDFLSDLQKQTIALKWKENYDQLRLIKTLEGLPLSEMINETQMKSDSSECLALNEQLNKELIAQRTPIASSNTTKAKVEQELSVLEAETTNILGDAEPEEWLNELKLLSDKVKNDTKHLLHQSKDHVDELAIGVIMDTFQLHKTEFVPNIYDLSLSLFKTFSSYKDLFSRMQISLSSFLQRLSQSQADMVILRERLKSTTQGIERVQELESHLARTVDLPLLYGLYIIEGIRRAEWLNSMKLQSAKVNENFAAVREKEIKTRSNWVKNYGDILKLLKKDISDFNSESLASFDLNVNENTYQIRQASFSYDDISQYIQQLEQAQCDQEQINVLVKASNELPLRLSKAVPASSNFGAKIEPRDSVIKGYQGRIKKLESLLHQEQFKNFQQWPSSGDRMSVMSRLSMNERLVSSTRSSSLKASNPSLQDSAEFTKLTEENRTLTNDLKRHKNTVEMLNQELKSLRHQLSTRDFEAQSLRKDIEDIKEEHSSEISRLLLQISQKEVTNAKLQSQVIKIEEEIVEHTTKTLEKDRLIGELKEEHKNAVGSVEKRLAEKDEEIKLIGKQLNDKEPVDDVQELKKESESLRFIIAQKDLELREKQQIIDKKERDVLSKTVSLKEKDTIIDKLANEKVKDVGDLREKNSVLEEEKSKLFNNLETLKENHERLSSMKNDLLENMSNRESEFAKEKTLHQEEIESLKLKVEEFEKTQSDYINEISLLGESQLKQTQTIVQLVVIINSLIIKSRDLSDILVIFYQMLCISLKSMGLLAVRSESDGKATIIRVKGLKKATGDLSGNIDLADGLKPGLEQAVAKTSSWVELPDAKLLEMSSPSEPGTTSESLDSIVNMLIETYNLTTFEDKYLAFVDCVTNLNETYTSSVSKRFREVEHLAKKELRENRKIKEACSKKISVRNFEVGDLVLFLPTRSNGGLSEHASQWAAFNDMGDGKFVLKNDLSISPQQQWFIGRILAIDKLENKEFSITAELTKVD